MAARRGGKTPPSAQAEALADKIRERFGDGSAIVLGGGARTAPQSIISSGVAPLNVALGIGGWPSGRVIEIFGPESSGKTTLALHAVVEAQRAGRVAAFVDAEHALDAAYAENLGVDLGRLVISQPDNGEQALNVTDTLCRLGDDAPGIVVVDSVAALIPQAELDGEIGDAGIALQARMMSQGLRRITSASAPRGPVVAFINQTRTGGIGGGGRSFQTTTGGNALKFYASMRVKLSHVGKVSAGEVTVGARIRAEVVKNKLAPPFARCEYEIRFGYGIDRISCLLDAALAAGVIEKAGAYFSFKNERIECGRQRVLGVLRTNAELAERIEAATTTAGAAGANFEASPDGEEVGGDE